MLELIGQTVSGFQVVSQLQEYPWGSKYKAFDPKMDRSVIMTVFPDHSTNNPERIKPLLTTGRSLMNWRNTGFARVYEIGQTNVQSGDSIVFLISEFLPGPNLHQILEELHKQNLWISLTEAINLIKTLSLTLEYAHKRNIFHANLSPKHIYFRLNTPLELPYQPVISDIGFSQLGYIPDQDAGNPYRPNLISEADNRMKDDDLYALGILLYELTTGQLPPGIYTPDATIQQSQNFILAPGIIREDLPGSIEEIIMTALSPNRKKSFSDIHAFYQQLQQAIPITNKITSPPEGFSGTSSLLSELEKNIKTTNKSELIPTFFEKGIELNTPEYMQDITKDHILIFHKDTLEQTITMQANGLSIGRAPENEIVIDHAGVSRLHARIDFSEVGYLVKDLGSRNGTFLNEKRLIPGKSYPWVPGENIRITETWLRLEYASQGATTKAVIADETAPAVSDDTKESSTDEKDSLKKKYINKKFYFSPGKRWIAAYLEAPTISISPGNSFEVDLFIQYQGIAIDNLGLSLDGLPLSWVQKFPTSIKIQPNEYQHLKLTLRVPRSSNSRAGRYRSTVRITSQRDSSESLELPLNITVTAFSLFESFIQPTTISQPESCQVFIHNKGNLPETYTLSWVDKNQALSFDPNQAKIHIPAGKSAAVEFIPVVNKSEWFSSEKIYPYTLYISSQSGKLHTHQGEVTSRGIIPPWAPFILIFLCLIISCVSIFLYNQFTLPVRSAQQTASAGQTALAVVIIETQEAATATALSLQNSDFATLQADTATSEWLSEDSDFDGLTNSEEIELGTQPDREDTDEDGLSDGDEINLWMTDPLINDTDQDGLSDGFEVQKGYDPLKKDTDGDGLNDAEDPDPLRFPTKTALSIPTKITSTPSSTPTEKIPTDTPTPTLESVDLSISMQNGQSISIPGKTITYTITIINSGPADVIDAIVTDMFPSSLSNITWKCSATEGSSCQVKEGTGNINNSIDILNGGSITFTSIAKLSPNATGVLINSANVSAPSNLIESNTDNNLAMDTDTLQPQVNLEINKTDDRENIHVGEINSYSIIVSNAGPSNVSGVNITDQFPSQIENITWVCEPLAGSSCTVNGEQEGDIQTNVNINAGGSIAINARGTIRNDATDRIMNTASIESPLQPEKNNKTGSDTTNILPLADLTIDISSPSSAPISSTITYTVMISNIGPSDASEIVFDLLLTEEVSIIDASPSSANCIINNSNITCNPGDLTHDTNLQILIAIKTPDSPGTITAQGAVLAKEDDPELTNNSQSFEIDIE
jgi:uncharacterized repeat protein (TIGR01451 family)